MTELMVTFLLMSISFTGAWVTFAMATYIVARDRGGLTDALDAFIVYMIGIPFTLVVNYVCSLVLTAFIANIAPSIDLRPISLIVPVLYIACANIALFRASSLEVILGMWFAGIPVSMAIVVGVFSGMYTVLAHFEAKKGSG